MQEWFGLSLVGDIFIKSSFVLILLSLLSLSLNKVYGSGIYLRISKLINIVVAMLLIGSVALLYFLIFNHRFEFHYVWKYTSLHLENLYLISSLWAGQNGSILFWITCQAIVLLFIKSNEKNTHIILIILSVQAILILLIIGIQWGDIHIGRSVFMLLREAPEYELEELFKNPNYLSFIKDGNDINPILKHWLMSIHPPLLFMGYVCTAYLYASASKLLFGFKDKSTLKQLRKWNVWSLFFISLGIISGGLWAHESLSFGGFWTWDPVENASLTIWLSLVISTHINLQAIKNKVSIAINAFANSLPFLTTLYTTFLTRSGLLNDTSVHAFADTEYKYLIFLLLALSFMFVLISVVLHLKKHKIDYKEMSFNLNKDSVVIMSMLLLLVLNMQIVLSISFPVINHIFNTNFTLPFDTINYYNRNTAVFLILINALFAISLFIGKRIVWVSFVVMMFVSMITVISLGLCSNLINSLLFITTFLTIGLVLFAEQKAIIKLIHISILSFVIFSIITFSETKLNTFPKADNRVEIADNDYVNLNENYKVRIANINNARKEVIRYKLELLKIKGNKDTTVSYIYPFTRLSKNFGTVNEPYIKRTLANDLFFNISSIEQKLPHNASASIGDTIINEYSTFIFKDLKVLNYEEDSGIIQSLEIKAYIDILTEKKIVEATLTYKIKNDTVFYEDAINEDLNIIIRFAGISEKENTINMIITPIHSNVLNLYFKDFPLFTMLIISLILFLLGLLFLRFV